MQANDNKPEEYRVIKKPVFWPVICVNNKQRKINDKQKDR